MLRLTWLPGTIKPEPRPCAFVTDAGKLPMLGMPKSADGRCYGDLMPLMSFMYTSRYELIFVFICIGLPYCY